MQQEGKTGLFLVVFFSNKLSEFDTFRQHECDLEHRGLWDVLDKQGSTFEVTRSKGSAAGVLVADIGSSVYALMAKEEPMEEMCRC